MACRLTVYATEQGYTLEEVMRVTTQVSNPGDTTCITGFPHADAPGYYIALRSQPTKPQKIATVNGDLSSVGQVAAVSSGTQAILTLGRSRSGGSGYYTLQDRAAQTFGLYALGANGELTDTALATYEWDSDGINGPYFFSVSEEGGTRTVFTGHPRYSQVPYQLRDGGTAWAAHKIHLAGGVVDVTDFIGIDKDPITTSTLYAGEALPGQSRSTGLWAKQFFAECATAFKTPDGYRAYIIGHFFQSGGSQVLSDGSVVTSPPQIDEKRVYRFTLSESGAVTEHGYVVREPSRYSDDDSLSSTSVIVGYGSHTWVRGISVKGTYRVLTGINQINETQHAGRVYEIDLETGMTRCVVAQISTTSPPSPNVFRVPGGATVFDNTLYFGSGIRADSLMRLTPPPTAMFEGALGGAAEEPCAPPPPPGRVRVQPDHVTRLTHIYWDAVAGADGYIVRRDGLVVARTERLCWQDGFAEASGIGGRDFPTPAHVYSVSAFNGCGEGPEAFAAGAERVQASDK